jgi:hypothetical protein
MSLNYNQIIGRIERTCGFNTGDIASNTQRKADFTESVNVALDDAYAKIFNKVNTGWQFDDSNHSAYPIIKGDIVSGQRDYSFTADEQGNIILDIFKVIIYDAEGVAHELEQVDRFGKNSNNTNLDSFSTTETGTPTRYDMLANGIFLDKIPNYDRGESIEVYISREGSYFNTSDTTKKAGFAGLYHEYLVLRPAYEYARDNGLKSVERLKRDLDEMTLAMETHYGNRGRDITRRLVPNREDNK